AKLGGDGSSSSPMKSLSAFMYAPLRMLPASLSADSSSSLKRSAGGPSRRSMSCASRNAVECGSRRRVRPVRSPVMRMSTAATGSSDSDTCGGISSSAAMVTVGTVIMMALCVIWESAVAACPAPMLAVSRSASSSRTESANRSAMMLPSHEPSHVHDERGRTVRQDGRPAEQRATIARGVESLYHDVLLARQLIHDESGAPLADLEHDDLLGVVRLPGQVHQLAQPQYRHPPALMQHDLAAACAAQLRPIGLQRFAHVRER